MSPNQKPALELHEDSAAKPTTMHLGDTLRLTLAENQTTGYKWQLTAPCSAILALESDQATPGDTRPGAPGSRTWLFRAHAQGQCELQLTSVRSWAPTAPGKTLAFPVTVLP